VTFDSVLTALADRLTDPEAVFGADSSVPAEHRDVTGGVVGLRDSISYPNGATGALAFLGTDPAALRASGPRYSRFVKRELALALRGEGLSPDRALIAVQAVGRLLPEDEWRTTLRAAGTSLAERTAALARTIRTRVESGSAPVFHEFDLLLGLGQGALALDVQADPSRALEVADALAAMLRDSPVPGSVRVDGPPFTGSDWDGDHINFGLAHGGAGALHALCSLLFRLGPARPADLEETAVHTLETLRGRAGSVPPFAAWRDGQWVDEHPQYRPSWCYGLVGHALVFAMGSLALDRPAYLRHATELLHEAFRRSDSFEDHSLCHGTAGLVSAGTIVGALDDGSESLRSEVLRLAEQMVADHDPRSPYGFAYTSRGFAAPVPVAGLLNGTAGIGLALALARDGLTAAGAGRALTRMSPWASSPDPAPSR
jgi:hypothetical protein